MAGSLLWLLGGLLALLKLYLWLRAGRCRSRRRMDGQTAIVTGANAGMGKETAVDLARRGARVILACRSLERGEQARAHITRLTGSRLLEVRLVDMGSLQSVRDFAAAVLATEPRLDVLVNNAGVAGLSHKRTADGLDITMQINHFGPFLLTNLLLDLLQKSAPSRVVMVSSSLHSRAKLELDNLNFDRPVGPVSAYGVSKLCNVLVAKELTNRLHGSGVTANSLHPGAVRTEVFRKLSGWKLLMYRVVSAVYFKSAEQGAQTIIHAAVSEELDGVSGKYLEDCKVSQPSSAAEDPWNARRVWELSEQAVGLASRTT